jgi:hypothetical protein
MALGTRLPKILVLSDGREVRTLAGARALIFGLHKDAREMPHWKQAVKLSKAAHVDRAFIVEFNALFKAALKAEGLIRQTTGEEKGSMPSRFNSGAYEPELVKIMGDALEAAWKMFSIPAKDVELARLHMASAIIDAVEGGVREETVLSTKAGAALQAVLLVNRTVVRKGVSREGIGHGGLQHDD